MKRLLIGFGIVMALLIVGVTMFLATFNVDRYRPQIVQALQDKLGKPVELQRLSLGWDGGIAVQADGLVLYDEPDKHGEPLLRLDSASAAVRLLPLLRRQVDVAYVRLVRPRVRVVRDADGRINWLGLLALGAPAAATGRTADVHGAPVAFHLDTVRVEDGDVWWLDNVSAPPMSVRVAHLDATLRHVSLTQPMEFNARVALWSARPNVRVNGRLQAPSAAGAGALDNARVDVDLSSIDVSAMGQAVPALAWLGLRTPLAGELSATLGHVPLEARRAGSVEAQVQILNGSVGLAALGSPVTSIHLEAAVNAGRAELKALTAKVAGGTIRVTGHIEHLDVQPRTALKLGAERLALDQLLPVTSPEAPRLRGTLSAAFEGASSGLAWADVSRTLAGTGRLQLTDATIERLNILREVLDRLSMLPRLGDKLRARLPETSRRYLEARDTVFKPLDLPLTVVNGAVVFRQVQVQSDAFFLSGSGQIGLNGVLSSQMMLAAEPGVSSAIVGSVKELQSLTDADGRFTVPITLQGRLPHVTVLPDVEYVAARLLATKTSEWLSGALEKLAPPRGSDSPATPPAQP